MLSLGLRFLYICGLVSFNRLGYAALHVFLPVSLFQATGSNLISLLSVGIIYLPFAFAPLAGLIIDARDQRRVFIASELAQALAVVAVFLAQMHEAYVALGLALFCLGLGSVFSRTISEFHIIPAVVPARVKKDAYRYYWSFVNFGYFAGPALAGLIIYLNLHWLFYAIYAGIFLLTALSFTVMRIAWPEIEKAGLDLASFATGLRMFRTIPHVRPLAAALFLYNIGVGVIVSIVSLTLANHYGLNGAWIGTLVSVFAAASILGSFLSGAMFRRVGLQKSITYWFLGSATAGLLMLAEPLGLFLLGVTVLHFFEGGLNVKTMQLRAEIIPDAMLGRVNGIMRVFIVLAMPLSSAVFGVAVDHLTGWVYTLIFVWLVAATALWDMSLRRIAAARAGSAPGPAGAADRFAKAKFRSPNR